MLSGQQGLRIGRIGGCYHYGGDATLEEEGGRTGQSSKSTRVRNGHEVNKRVLLELRAITRAPTSSRPSPLQ